MKTQNDINSITTLIRKLVDGFHFLVLNQLPVLWLRVYL